MFITNIGRLVTMAPSNGKMGELGVIEDAAVEVEGGRIRAVIACPSTRTCSLRVNSAKQSPGKNCIRGIATPPSGARNDKQVIDAQGSVVIPGLIDCHTHLVHAGDRVNEFAMRARGATYEEIARAGGGIMSTVRATREAGEDELFELAKGRAKEAIGYGITTLEVKSGYGLDLDTEIKMLYVIKRLNMELPIEFVPTFLAHMVPKEMSFPRSLSPHVVSGERESRLRTRWSLPPNDLIGDGDDRGDYIHHITHDILPAVAKKKLAKFCDVFVENIAFTKDEAETILKAAARLGMRAKLHADQLTQNGGAALAARLKAVSADHLENISKKDIKALAGAGTVAVLIPSSTFFIGRGERKGDCPPKKRGQFPFLPSPYAPAREMIDAKVDIAISTDYNPGTSPILNLWLAAAMAITQMGLTPEEAYRGITINAACALDMEKTHGSIAVGKTADLVVLNTKNEFEPFYRFDKNFVSKVIKGGEVIYG